MPEPFPPQINWQPVESLPLIGSMVDGLLDEAERQYVNLMSCRSRPHVLDDFKVYSDQAGDFRRTSRRFVRGSRIFSRWRKS